MIKFVFGLMIIFSSAACSLSADLQSLLTAPLHVEVLAPVPDRGNVETTLTWVLRYSGAKKIKLQTSDITLYGTATQGCAVSIVNTAANERAVRVTGCSGEGNVGISVAENTAEDSAGNGAEAPKSEDLGLISNLFPAMVVSAPESLEVDGSNAPKSNYWVVTYSGASEVTLNVEDISLVGDSAHCEISVAESNGLEYLVTAANCSASSGEVSIHIRKGSARNSFGNLAPAYGSAPAVTLLQKLTAFFSEPLKLLTTTSGSSQQGIKIELSSAVTSETTIDYVVNSLSNLVSNLGRGSVKIPAGQKSVTVPYEITGGRLGEALSISLENVRNQDGDVYIYGPVARHAVIHDDFAQTAYKQVAMGNRHSCAIVEDGGELRCWGLNNSGQLGDGTLDNKDRPVVVDAGVAYEAVSAGENHTCGIVAATKSVKCWGYSGDGRLGHGIEEWSSISLPVAVQDPGVEYEMIAAGYDQTCGLVRGTGQLKCWGDNSYGQNGTDLSESRALAPTVISTESYSYVTTGYYRSCAITKETAQLQCWGGSNYNGQLGIGSSDDPVGIVSIDGTEKYTSVVLGRSHTCGLLTSGQVKCWGSTPGVGNGLYGDNMYSPVKIDIGVKYSQIMAGQAHSCGQVLGTQNWKCWGPNNQNFGNGFSTYALVPINVSRLQEFQSITSSQFNDRNCGILRQSKSLACWDYTFPPSSAQPSVVDDGQWYETVSVGALSCGTMIGSGKTKCWGSSGGIVNASETISPVALDTEVSYSSVAAGLTHACGIMTDTRQIKCWGNQSEGRLGNGNGSNVYLTKPVLIDEVEKYILISVGSVHSCGITEDQRLKCWGGNSARQVGLAAAAAQLTPIEVDPTRFYSSVSAGDNSTCAVERDSKMVRCWGNGNASNLQVSGPGELFKSVSVGRRHSCGVLDSTAASNPERVMCWGTNSVGEMGIASMSNGSSVTTPRLIDHTETYKSIHAGAAFTCGLTNSEEVFCWGSNTYAQLGVTGPNRSTATQVNLGVNVSDVASGVTSACAIGSDDRTLRCWGSYSSLGQGQRSFYMYPVKDPI